MDAVTVDGKVIAAPTLLQSYLVFANSKLLEKAGVTVPTGATMTWDQFADLAKEVDDEDRHPGRRLGPEEPDRHRS